MLGIEIDSNLIEKAEETFAAYEIPRSSFSFVMGDIYDLLPKIPVCSVDTVFFVSASSITPCITRCC